MKKWILILALITMQGVLANELQNVGIAKYAVLEVLDNNVPLRVKDNENSTRITHLFKNAVLFAECEINKKPERLTGKAWETLPS